MRLDRFRGDLFSAIAALVFGFSIRAESVRVRVSDFSFSPASVIVKPGDSVTWTNLSGSHNVASSTGVFGNGIAPAPWQYSYTFTGAGKFSYVCQAHSFLSMGGYVLVRLTNALPDIAFT